MPPLRALVGYGALAAVLLLCLKLISLAPLAFDWGRELAGAAIALLAVAVGWRLARRAIPRDADRALPDRREPAPFVDAGDPVAAVSERDSVDIAAATPTNDVATVDEGQALSPRERDVLRLLGAGRSNKEIARALHLSENTVKTHLAKLYGKLGVGRRTEAMAVALQRGLLEGEPSVTTRGASAER